MEAAAVPRTPAGIAARIPSPVEEVRDERLGGVRLLLKRDDLIHPEIPGNKWRKLKYNLAPGRVLTFGGAYSNHIRAVAAAGAACGFETIGVIRGEEHLPLNPSLAYAVERGMRLAYLDRSAYRRKHTPEVIDALRAEFGDFRLLPEGGSNAAAVRGCAEIAPELDAQLGGRYDLVCCPVGTGGTLAGLAAGLPPGRRAIGFSALKGGEFLDDEVARLQREALGRVTGDWRVECGFHFGGYARSTPELREFADGFAARHGLRLDLVYVAKMMYGIFTLARELAPGTVVVAVITG
ncbi:1-aminocyclopropane-1-carboxylate deaminase/D-cysteine desulfhydrase [Microtetraspora niveoalba]|uniref:1-aminocyclopropane-1-carboxylate deaminase/D-cysteine desulfhydrase n=1 Tax=Microtetraspora niveoalba TaxID=46175 RepID=UPI00082ABD1F|nr:pyridoxal-phosphate dependent enzyme [Microtetraspora niveoalba]